MKTPTRNRMWAAGAVLAVLVAFGLGLSMRPSAPSNPPQPGSDPAQATAWTCSMHPQIRMPNPGQCPICGMDLIPLQMDHAEASGPRTLTLSPTAIALAEIQTTMVERRPVETTLRMVGKLEPDEGRVREISAWVPGRIERLFIDSTGIPVQKGQALFELYSPELYSAQEELLQAIKAGGELRRSNLESTRRSATRTVDAARERLRLWGLTAEQIHDIETRGTPSERVSIVAPMSGTVLHKAAVEGSYVQTGTHVYAIADLSVLWLKLDVYEADLEWIALDQQVVFSTEAFPGVPFEGRVSFIDPVLDEKSRSVKVRVAVDNADGRLKPGMFARAQLHAAITREDGRSPLVIPRTAPLVTGKRAVVYVADPVAPGQFQGREIVLGREAGDMVVVREGLQEGDRVVTNGAFKIDSALQIQAKTSMMNPAVEHAILEQSSGGASMPMASRVTAMGTAALEAIPQEIRKSIDEVLLHYYQVSDALSHDDLGRARGAAGRIPGVLRTPQGELLPSDARDSWNELRQGLSGAAQAVATATDIEAARHAFHLLSQRTIQTVRLLGASGNTAVYVYHCPMAQQGAGADWLQPFEGVENPYFGAEMFSCGEHTETLVDVPADSGSNHEIRE